MSDNWPSSLINLTINSALISGELSSTLEKTVKEKLPNLHSVIKGKCRILTSVNVALCLADCPRFDQNQIIHVDPHSIPGSPFNSATITITVPRQESNDSCGYGLGVTDVQNLVATFKTMLISDPFKIDEKAIFVVPIPISISMEQEANK